ncbi:MAG: NAD-dependent dihydropyrimidine dehydrogenase PreA subunit [Planctomycetota bacterium]|jgi:NAD-dependent dihydropyrimidine dehydrogenase PreA subunit
MKTLTKQANLTAADLRQLLLDAGADDAACVSVNREELAEERLYAQQALPGTQTLISYCVRMNREPIRTPQRSVANLEFHHAGDEINEIGRRVVRALEERGLRALNPPMGFPMEMDKFPGRTWVISHKRVAEAAGLGVMGIHHNVIHPRFGNFILLGTLLLEATLDEEAKPLDFNPCLECKLCVAACPVGAIGPKGEFDFSACYTHNYREFMGGFTDWVEDVADSKNAHDYRKRVSDSESASMWQSLSFGANYKAAYCLSVCPAGEDVIAPFQEDRAQFMKTTLKPLQAKVEALYVMPGSDAKNHAERRFPHKQIRLVGKVLRPTSIAGFIHGMPLVFQRGIAKGEDSTFHFSFTGEEERKITVIIRDSKLQIEEGHTGIANLLIQADSRSWVRFLRGELNLALALLSRKLRLKGSWKHLLVMDKVFV